VSVGWFVDQDGKHVWAEIGAEQVAPGSPAMTPAQQSGCGNTPVP
jgi:hypothetical protein